MSSPENAPKAIKSKPLVLLGNGVSSVASQAAGDAGLQALPASIGHFGSGEPFVELFYKEEADFEKNAAQIKGRDVLVIQSAGAPVSDNSLHLLMMVNTLKSYGAAQVTVAMPFAPFMRQDRAFDRRFVSLGAAFFARQLQAAGADKVMTLTPHSQGGIKAYQAVFGNNFTPLTTTDLFAADIRARFAQAQGKVRIGAPDGADKPSDEGQIRARLLAEKVLEGTGRSDVDSLLFKIAKTHTGVSATKITGFTGDVAGADCVIVDDMIDGGSTMINAASLLKSRGAKSVTCYATHGILSGNALEKILLAKPDGMSCAVDRLVVTDTLPDVADKVAVLARLHPQSQARVNVLPVTGLFLAQAGLPQPAPACAASKTAPKP